VASHRLSKSRYQTGLQCARALWLTVHRPALKDAVPDARQHIFDLGTRVGELARLRHPDGVLVAEDHLHQADALATTRRLMDAGVPALFEAAFEAGGVLVRVDLLVRVYDGAGGSVWDLYEVKASTQVKAQHHTDVAVQAATLEAAGLTVRRACVVHLDNTYVWSGGEHDVQRLFVAEDITAEVRALMPAVPGQVQAFLTMLTGDLPAVPIGKHCDAPYRCDFYESCHAHLPEPPVTALPRLKAELLDSLVRDGILGVRDIPPDYPGLTPAQREVVTLVRTGEPRMVGDVRRTLAPLDGPLHFLDFETFSAAVPVYPGTRPYQAIPFQWSNHVVDAHGALTHREFLHEEASDPRVAFIESLLDATAGAGTVFVYSAYEHTQLTALAAGFPRYAAPIAALQARLFDLEKVVKAHVRHPACLGRTSIKVVLPALVRDLSYAGLAIADGEAASRLYLQFVLGLLTPEAVRRLFGDLRAYCGTDTLAMVRLWQALRGTSA